MFSSEADSQKSTYAPSLDSPGHGWDASAALVYHFFKMEQGDTHCSLHLGILGKYVQFRKIGDAYRGPQVHR